MPFGLKAFKQDAFAKKGIRSTRGRLGQVRFVHAVLCAKMECAEGTSSGLALPLAATSNHGGYPTFLS